MNAFSLCTSLFSTVSNYCQKGQRLGLLQSIRLSIPTSAFVASLRFLMRRQLLSATLFLAFPLSLFLLLPVDQVAAQKTFIVNSLGDAEDPNALKPGDDKICNTGNTMPSGEPECTLRAAIQNHNAQQSVNDVLVRNEIIFNIDLQQLGVSTPVIEVGSATNEGLPFVLGIVTIDGTTQLDPSGNPLMVVLEGSQAGTFASGLELRTGGGAFQEPGEGTIIRGFAIHSFDLYGIVIGGTGSPGLGGHVIEGCHIGTDPENSPGLGNGGHGIYIEDTPNNTIGGETVGASNVISGNTGDGIRIEDTFQQSDDNLATNNRILGNFIGTDAGGASVLLGNGGDGVHIVNAASNSVGSPIFELEERPSNLISGNAGAGVHVEGTKAINNAIIANFIGTNGEGGLSSELGNGSHGVLISNAPANTIGGLLNTEGNVIGGNKGNGVHVVGTSASDNVIEGNEIGINRPDDILVPNEGDGVHIANAPGNTIGAPRDEFMVITRGNLISGNQGDGVHIEGSSATNNIVLGNHIGTNLVGGVAGSSPRPNEGNGVFISDAPDNIIGGMASEARNLISGNQANGISIENALATSNKIGSNFIGTDAEGSPDNELGNGGDGVLITNAPDNTIGGTITVGQAGTPPGNLISGNQGNGIQISGLAASGNKVEGNIVGLDANSNVALPNALIGVFLNDAPNNSIGGPSTPITGEKGNVISSNLGHGIELNGANANNNIIQSNLIGTNGAETEERGNQGDGIHLLDAPSNTVGGGGLLLGEVNIISGNIGNGVSIQGIGAINNNIRGNLIGLNTAGKALSNGQDGILINGASNNVIGGNQVDQNTIAGNDGNGIQITGLNARDNFVFNNLIGLHSRIFPLGEPLPNGLHGVLISNAPANTIGGLVFTPAGLIQAGNIISGNNGDGIHITGVNATGNIIQLNRIGTDLAGLAAIPNEDGVQISDAPTNLIGGVPANDGNLISGNLFSGVRITGTGATGNRIEGNIIGLNTKLDDQLSNLTNGVHITGASNNIIGAAGSRNIIAGNGGSGVVVEGNTATGNAIRFNLITRNGGSGVVVEGNTTTGNAIRFNSIFDNSQLGIDLGDNDVTPNDPLDPDPGPNNLQNFPVLTSALIFSEAPPRFSITGSFNGTPNTNFIIDFYANTLPDPSGFGEGQISLGTTTVTTDGSGNVIFTFGVPGVPPLPFVSATATDPNNNTSEFSNTIGFDSLPQLADLELTKKVDQASPTVGEQITFTVTLLNKGPNIATGIAVTDAEPTGLTFDMVTPSTGSYNKSTGIWTVGTLAIGDSAKLTILATVNQAGTLTNTAEVTSADQLDPDSSPGNNAADEDDQDSTEVEATEVLTVEEQIARLINQVDSLMKAGTLTPGEARSLKATLITALKLVKKEKNKAAANVLKSFVLRVQVLIFKNRLPDEEGQKLIAAAQAIIKQIRSNVPIATVEGEVWESSSLPMEPSFSEDYSLYQNYPNPFTVSTIIHYELPEPGQVRLVVYDALGWEIARLVDSYHHAGRYQITLDGQTLSAGHYLYVLQAGGRIIARKMILKK